jgi:NAD(P)-dependent dehydrogenase (short-subunit alcohol dehydrogenase family)
MAPETHITSHTSSITPPPGLFELATARWAVKHPPVDQDVTFAWKTILVTGANVGLGFEAAIKYAQKDASELILAARSLPKAEAAKQGILRGSRRKDENFIFIPTVDLSSFESVHAFIKDLEVELGEKRLHVALLNASLVNPTFVKNANDYE